MTLTFGYIEFPVFLKICDDGLEILVCDDCGYPVGVTKPRKTRYWHCYHCQKVRRGGSFGEVRWVVTKEARS